MKLLEALKASDSATVLWKKRQWHLARNYDGRLDFVSMPGHWGETWLSNHLEPADVMTEDTFEPIMRGKDDENS